jgi:hypothetical protein
VLQSRDAYRLARDGTLVEATVTDARIATSETSDRSKHFLTYTYSRNGQTITNERAVPTRFFQTHPIGTAWTITVHTDDPSQHELFDGEMRQSALSALIFSALLALFGALLALSGGNLNAQRHRLSS